MRRPKLGFRNKSALEQLQICQRVIANLARAPKAQLVNVALADTRAAVGVVRASHERLEQLKADLKAETRRRNELLHIARGKVTRAQLGQLANLNPRSDLMQAAGMELPVSKRRSVGLPAKVANVRAVPRPIPPTSPCAGNAPCAAAPLRFRSDWRANLKPHGGITTSACASAARSEV